MIATNRPSGIFVSPASMQSASSGKNGKSIVKNKNISCFSSMIGRYFSITPLSRNRCTVFRPSARAAKNTITDPAITASTPKIIAGQKPSASAPAIIEMLLGIGATMTVIICSAKYTAPAQTPAPAITSRSASTELIFSKNPFFQSAQPPAAKSAATASAAKMMRIIFFRFINSFNNGRAMRVPTALFATHFSYEAEGFQRAIGKPFGRAYRRETLHNTAAAIVYPHVNTTSSAAQTDSPTACAARLFRLCACRIGSVASA